MVVDTLPVGEATQQRYYKYYNLSRGYILSEMGEGRVPDPSGVSDSAAFFPSKTHVLYTGDLFSTLEISDFGHQRPQNNA